MSFFFLKKLVVSPQLQTHSLPFIKQTQNSYNLSHVTLAKTITSNLTQRKCQSNGAIMLFSLQQCYVMGEKCSSLLRWRVSRGLTRSTGVRLRSAVSPDSCSARVTAWCWCVGRSCVDSLLVGQKRMFPFSFEGDQWICTKATQFRHL